MQIQNWNTNANTKTKPNTNTKTNTNTNSKTNTNPNTKTRQTCKNTDTTAWQIGVSRKYPKLGCLINIGQKETMNIYLIYLANTDSTFVLKESICIVDNVMM